MRKTVVCMFAHPDDESFGPSGIIYNLAQKNDVYIICATKGQAQAKNSKDGKMLGKLRADELRKSAKILGVKRVYFLGYSDGMLSNKLYHKIARKVQRITDRLQPHTFITYEMRGISGHLDHIAISLITSFVFYKTSYAKELLYYCITQKEAEKMKDYFIFFPPGYSDSEINYSYDVADVWDKKVEAMKQHESQKKDMEKLLDNNKDLPKKEHFFRVVK